MFKLLVLLVILYSSLIQASFSLPMVEWHKLSEVEKASVWFEYKTALSELEVSAHDKVAGYSLSSVISEAYATGFDCFVAGWPSQKIKNSCSSPEKSNPHYNQHLACPKHQILCHPAVFGEGLCAEFKTTTQKNTAFSQCEKKFTQEGRLYSDVLSEVDPEEMSELISAVHQKCAAHSANYTCQKLRTKLDFIIPNETPVNYKLAKDRLNSNDPKAVLSASKALQREMEIDINHFEKNCGGEVSEGDKRLCKNIALRVKKAEALLPQMFNRMKALEKPVDCVNCSTPKGSTILKASALPSLEAVGQLQCTEVEKKKISARCFDDVKCVIMATAMSAPLAIMEAFGKKPDACLSSQNDCLTNVVSALIDSLLSLVTGLWDLLGTAVEWTGEKLAHFWNYVTKIEDKTSDAQHMLNKMSAKEVEEVKQNPLEWISNLAGNIWKGLGEWMKEDIFCEKWAGIPRASQCLEPSRGFDCMSCRTMITGTCSAAGVIIGEVLPAVLTGGGANLVARAGSGAKAFSKFIKVSKSYKKVISVVDKLSDVKAIRLMTQVTKAASKPVSRASKIGFEALSSSYQVMVKSKTYKALSKSMDVAAKYTGLKAVNNLNSYLYTKGYGFVDATLGVRASTAQVPRMLSRMDEAAELVARTSEELKPVYDDLAAAEKLRVRYRALVHEGEEFKKMKDLTPAQLERNTARAGEMKILEGEIYGVNQKFVENISAVFEKQKIPFTLSYDSHRAQMLVLDFSQPSSNYAVEMYRRVSERFGLNKITLSLNENTLISSRGFFMSHTKRIDMGPEQAMDLLREHFNTVSKHESRHGMFFAKRAKGKESIFHVRFKSSAAEDFLNDKKFYHEYMSAEELYTFSTDIQSLAQGLKGEYLIDVLKRDEILKAIGSKNKNLGIVATTSRDMSQGMMDSIDEALKLKNPSQKLEFISNRDETFTIVTKDKLGRKGEMIFVSPSDKNIVKHAKTILTDLEAKKKIYIDKKMSDAGVNLGGLERDRNYGQISAQHQQMLQNFEAQYLASSEGQSLTHLLDNASRAVFEKTRHQFSELNKMSAIQLRQSEILTKELTLHHSTQSPSQLKVARDQMFKMAKNVKEDYSGFALKSAK